MIIGINGNEANVTQRVGSNQYAFQLLKQLKIFKKPQFVVYLKKPPVSDMPKESSNWRYQVFGPGRLWTQLALPLKLWHDRNKLDVFFTPGHYGPRFCPVPSVVCILDLAFLKYPQSFRPQDLTQLKSWTKYSVKQAQKIIAISQATKKDIVSHYGAAQTKIKVIYPGLIELKKGEDTTVKVLKKYRFKPPYLLYIGTLQPRKNLTRLIQAFASIPPNLSTCGRSPGGRQISKSLVIVGKKGWMYKSIFDQVKQLKLEKQVIFTGYLSDQELVWVCRQAEVLINPSLYEGFGFPVLGAMAQGTLVLVSRSSSLPEIVGQAGLYIDQPDSVESIKKGIIKALSLSSGQKASLIKQAKQRAKTFTWQKTAKQTLEILTETGGKK
ncbi:glycosyltransferase family 4 protein [Patescibacteria group bacterium]|nr:glycosyltransferase family 4 protein [Patescibacteria group bacterium]MBU1931636.1 glycosyltransferase family 4 protein [Patescibacteria group bacterium]